MKSGFSRGAEAKDLSVASEGSTERDPDRSLGDALSLFSLIGFLGATVCFVLIFVSLAQNVGDWVSFLAAAASCLISGVVFLWMRRVLELLKK